ncbi:hypothetical protein JCM33374_g6401 [Metschnikowia sp. JCM 33374]|nr:hypothetical protein JCM33374_g6401 [Metschnikowia sp. JCM 33374]
MENFSVSIILRQSWNNLVDLPSNVVSLLYNANVSPQDVIVELVSSSRDRNYVGWSGMNSNSPMSVGIDPVLAHALKLSETQSVVMNVTFQNLRSTRILLEPEHFSDWELVELHAAYVESKLIEQSRCVAVDQVLVVYPTRTSSVRLKVKDIGLNHHFALIDPFAEVSISPKKNAKKPASGSQAVISDKFSQEGRQNSPCLLKRGITIPNILFSQTSENSGFAIYGNPTEFTHAFGNTQYVSVSIITGPNSKSNKGSYTQANSKNIGKSKSSALISENKHIVARFISDPESPKNTVGLSEKLAVALNVEHCLGFKVVMKQPPKNTVKRLPIFTIHPFTVKGKKTEALEPKFSKDFQDKFSEKLCSLFFTEGSISLSPISNFCKLPIIPKYLPNGGILVFRKILDPYAWIKPSNSCSSTIKPKIELGDPIARPFSDIQEKGENSKLETIYGIDVLLNELSEHLSSFKKTGVMVYGTQGSGKSAILKYMAKTMRDEYGFFANYVTCEALMNDNPDQIRLKMTKWTHEAMWNEPSVIILDNLDKLLSAEVENADSSTSNQLTDFFISLLRNIYSQNNTNVSIIVSGTSKDSFNKSFEHSHLIEKYCHMNAPDKATRTTILGNYLSDKLDCSLSFDLMDIVSETEGYLPNDLKVLSDRMYYESLHNSMPTECESRKGIKVSYHDFQAALSGFKPSSLRGVKLEKSSTRWADIGGMYEAKRVLLETLEWPTKYAPIFDSCPLRLRSGLLLYGYPGCGKTLLASAIAGQCGLNFISIKGPEILNKYIGASEQSVRELFERAQSAKPCILFFDEFDSIAPKRGHDSTGVTDRVVNQMLTQMDGAEGLDGVYVLAATSRPDLIDSALLRPGRLDKSIFCDMPDYNDRLNILSSICAKMDLSADVQLEAIANKTRGFSGADLQGLGYNAYLQAVHEKLIDDEKLVNGSNDHPKRNHDFFLIDSENSSCKIKSAEKAAISSQIHSLAVTNEENINTIEAVSEAVKPSVWIKQAHFLNSLKESKSSISSSERTKLHRIYSEFSTSRDGDMPDGTASYDIGGRTTLM